MKRPPSVHEFKPVHTEGQIIGPAQAELGLVRYRRLIQLVVCGSVIGLMACLLITNYYRARGPARLTDCVGRQRVLGNALEMYRGDNGSQLPPGPAWRWAVSDYLDMVGGNTEGLEDLGRRARPRSFSSPMRCLANQTTIPISYFYLDPAEVWQTPERREDPGNPVLVDEINHRSVVVLRADWSSQAVPREDWMTERSDVLHIARRPDWRQTFAYCAAPVSPRAPSAATSARVP